jgi:hypothetical protein
MTRASSKKNLSTRFNAVAEPGEQTEKELLRWFKWRCDAGRRVNVRGPSKVVKGRRHCPELYHPGGIINARMAGQGFGNFMET